MVDGHVVIRAPLLQALDTAATRERRRAAELNVLRIRSGHPAVWSAHAAVRFRDLELPAPSALVGDPLLVTATGAQGAIYRLPRTPEPHPGELAPLRDSAAHAWNTTQRVALRSLPLVTGDAGWTPPPAGVLLLGGPPADVVDGDSFGLSFVLAHASRGMGIPIPAHIAATAVVREDGTLAPVTGLTAKLRALRDHAPAVRVLLIAETQPLSTEDTTILDEAAIEAQRRGTVAAALPEVFSDTEQKSWAERWSTDPGSARRIARALFREMVDPQPFKIPFKAFVATTQRLQAVSGLPAQVRWEARVAGVIAARKGKTGTEPLPPAPEGLKLPRQLRLMLLAHQIQAANDRCDPDWEPLVDDALRQIHLGLDAYKGDLMVMGAAGRCYGAWGRWDDARTWLRTAVECWYALDQHPEASFPLSEWVRVEGLTAPDLRTVQAHVDSFLQDTRVADDARAYMTLAQIRAWIIQGDVARAAALLEQTPRAVIEATPMIRPSLARWCARAGLPYTQPADQHTVFDTLQRIQAGDSAAENDLEPEDRARWERCKQVEPAGGVRRWLDMIPY